MKILAFAASNHSNSINKQLVTYISNQFENQEVEVLDLNDYEMPIYSIDRESNGGIPNLAVDLAKKIDDSDLVIISLAEYNGTYTAAFKNIFDWLSRVPNRKTFNDKNIFLTATSPGARGALTVLENAKITFPFHGGNIIDTFSLPFFGKNFSIDEGILEEEKREELKSKIEKIQKEYFN